MRDKPRDLQKFSREQALRIVASYVEAAGFVRLYIIYPATSVGNYILGSFSHGAYLVFMELDARTPAIIMVITPSMRLEKKLVILLHQEVALCAHFANPPAPTRHS